MMGDAYGRAGRKNNTLPRCDVMAGGEGARIRDTLHILLSYLVPYMLWDTSWTAAAFGDGWVLLLPELPSQRAGGELHPRHLLCS